MKSMKWLFIVASLLIATSLHAQTSFVTDRAMQQVNVLGTPTPLTAAIPYASVRVCSLPLTQQQPCLPLATISDINGNTLSNSIGSNFGQFFTDVTGRYTFGCTVNTNYQVQIAPSASNTPATNYPVSCPGFGNNLGSNLTFSGNTTFTGAVTATNPAQIGASYYASDFAGATCGDRINAFEAAISTPAEFVADSTCPAGTWATVTISRNNHTLRCPGPSLFTVNQIILAGNFDKLDSCYLIQVGGTDQYTILVSGNDGRILNNTIDGTASQPSKNGSDNCLEVKGSRNWIENNRIIACQGNGIAVEASAAGGDHNTITKNKVYNANVATFGTGIIVGNISPSNGSFANFNDVLDNYVDTTNADCIFLTASEGSISLSGGTLNKFNKVNGNTTTNCGDSSIEIGEGSYESTVSYNTIDAKLNGGIICRDCINPHFIGNRVTMESTTVADGISVGNQNLPASFDQHAQVEGNVVRGWISSGRACFNNTGAGAHFKANDCEFTAGAANVHSITDAAGTATLVTNQPLLLPNGQSIIITGTTNYNGTFTLLSVNDLTNTYTFSHGAAATETAGTIAFITSTGSNLQGIGINCNLVKACSAQGNRIKNVNVGIEFDADAAIHSVSEMFAEGNWIIRTAIPIDIQNITCSGCSFSNNHLLTYVTVGIKDNGSSSGSGNSYIWGNTFSGSGFGTTPGANNNNWPNYLGMNPYQDATFTNPVLRTDSGGFMCHESSNPVTVGPGWQTFGCNNSSHMFQAQYGSNPSIPFGTTGNTSGTHSDSGFYQTAGASGCTTAASIGGVCATPITITWPIAFADTNYKVTCTPVGVPTALPSNPYVVTPSAGNVTVNYYANSAVAASWPTVNCTAVHN